MSTNRVTATQVHESLAWLRDDLAHAGMLAADDRWEVQEGSATNGRAWRVYLPSKHTVNNCVMQQIGGAGGYLGDTARDALNCVQGARRVLRGVIDARDTAQRETLEHLAASGCVTASLTLSLMDDGFTYTDALAASSAFVVSQ